MRNSTNSKYDASINISGNKHLLSSFTFTAQFRKNIWAKCLESQVKTCSNRAAPSSCGEETHLNDLEKRSERSRATSPPFTWQSRTPHSLRTHLLLLTLFVFMFSPIQQTAELRFFFLLFFSQYFALAAKQDCQEEDALRAPGLTTGER